MARWRATCTYLAMQNAGRLVNCLFVHCTERSVPITVSRSSSRRVPAIFVQIWNVATNFSEKSHMKIRSAWVAVIQSDRRTDTHDEAGCPYSHSASVTRLKWNNYDGKLDVNACRLIYIHFRSTKTKAVCQSSFLYGPYTDNLSCDVTTVTRHLNRKWHRTRAKLSAGTEYCLSKH